MTLKATSNHQLVWVDVLDGVEATSWFDILKLLFHKKHGFSNYKDCLKRDHTQTREQVMQNERIKQFINSNDANRRKVVRVLDEMCHLLDVQGNPSRKLKFAGLPFLKCITKVYSKIYLNTHLFEDDRQSATFGIDRFKEHYLKMSSEMPVVILPTHRSYMDFLFITYIMFINELPLPIVAAGDNFKAMGKLLLDYLKGTGAFIVRRAAQNKKDIDALTYYEILKAYVESILVGGENPLEFFMEGTRSRVGHVLKPKTGLLSMVVDSYFHKLVKDIYIMPVSISYQRPIEEQLYVAENVPQSGLRKPKENARNLMTALETVMKRKYGKVYIRFVRPFKISECLTDWKASSVLLEEETVLQDFTNHLATRVCMAQAYNNILMPYNLLTFTIVARSFFGSQNILDISKNGVCESSASTTIGLPFNVIVLDFYEIEKLLKNYLPNFVPGWRSHLEIFEEFKIDRDGLIRASSDRKFIVFENDAVTLHTMLYYSNQVMQIFLPLAICLLSTKQNGNRWEQFQDIRRLLAVEYLLNDYLMEEEFKRSDQLLQTYEINPNLKKILLKHLVYLIECYMLFLEDLERNKKSSKTEFIENQSNKGKNQDFFISMDMLKNMFSLVKELDICSSTVIDGKPLEGRWRTSSTNLSNQTDELLEVKNEQKLQQLIGKFQQMLNLIPALDEQKNIEFL